MKIRWKFLSFLAVFLLGSFLIVTWKSYSIFSQKYVKSLQQMEIQSLEKQGQYISQQFTDLQKILSQPEQVESQLRARNIGLLAHVVNESGKWKAQWFEGQDGYRKEAQNLTKQLSFESLPTTRKSWHLVQMQERVRSYAYVVPAVTGAKVSYFVFFLSKDYLQKLFKGQSFLETLVAYSPHIGQIYSMGDLDDSILETSKANLRDKQSGFIPTGKHAGVFFYFHPDLQLYLLKSQKIQALQVESPMYMVTLFAIIVFLIGLSMLAFDLLLKNIFGRLEYVTASLRHHITTPSDKKHFTDEMQEIEYLVHYLEDGKIHLSRAEVQESQPSEAETSHKNQHEEFLQQIRPKAINSLGYFHRIKAQVPASPNLQLLEKELREMRALIDPATSTAQGLPPTPAQPYFNPILDTFKKETALIDDTKVSEAIISEAAIAESKKEALDMSADKESEIPTAQEIAKEVAEAMKAISSLTIRKPKRESHESDNL